MYFYFPYCTMRDAKPYDTIPPIANKLKLGIEINM